MAEKRVLVSDLSGDDGATTITFGIRGTWYEIDLTADEECALDKGLDLYVTNGRPASRRPSTRRPSQYDTTLEEREAMRAWGRENGYAPADRGRITKKLIVAYRAAHPRADGSEKAA